MVNRGVIMKAQCEICYFTQRDIFAIPKEDLKGNNSGEDCNPLHTREEKRYETYKFKRH